MTDPQILAVDPDPIQIRRVLPAEVTLPDDRSLRGALVIVTRVGVFVWSTTPADDTPALVLAAEYDRDASQLPREHLLRSTPMTLTTEEGDVIVRKARGCGCGSKLAALRPFTRSGA